MLNLIPQDLVKKYRNIKIDKVPIEDQQRLCVLRFNEKHCPACEVKITHYWFDSSRPWCKVCECYWQMMMVSEGADKRVLKNPRTIQDYNKRFREKHGTEMGV